MLGLRLLFRRIRGFSFGRMLVYVREVKKETKMPCLFIVLDMLLCVLLYNVGFFDYHIFGFVHIRRHRDRKTFFTMRDNWRLCRLVNRPEDARSLPGQGPVLQGRSAHSSGVNIWICGRRTKGRSPLFFAAIRSYS